MTDNLNQSFPLANPSQVHPLLSQYSAIELETKTFEESLENIISQFKLIKKDIQPKYNPEEAQSMLEEFRQQFQFYSNKLFAPQQPKQQDLSQQQNSKLIATNQFITRIKDKHQVYVIKKKAFYQTVKKFQEIVEEMKKTNRRKQDIQNEILKKQDKTADMLQKLSQTEHYQLHKVKNLQNEIEELLQVHTKQNIDIVRIRSDFLFMKQYLNECKNPTIIFETEQLQLIKRNNDQDEQLKQLQSRLSSLKNNFDVNNTFSKLQEQLNMINDANSKILQSNAKLSSLFDEISQNIQYQNGNETKIERYSTLNPTQMNDKVLNIQKEFSTLDKQLKDFLVFMQSIMDKQKSISLGMQIKKHIQSNLQKQTQLNNINSQISTLNKKLLKMNNNSNKNKLKEKKANIRKKNDQLMQLDMEKDAKITELQMKIQNQKHKKMMKDIQENKLEIQQEIKIEKKSVIDYIPKFVQSSRKSKSKTAKSKRESRQSVDSFEKKKNKAKKRTSKD